MGRTNINARREARSLFKLDDRVSARPFPYPYWHQERFNRPGDAAHARGRWASMSIQTRPIGRADVLATTLGVGAGRLRRPPIGDAIARARGSYGVSDLPMRASLQGVINPRPLSSAAIATVP